MKMYSPFNVLLALVDNFPFMMSMYICIYLSDVSSVKTAFFSLATVLIISKQCYCKSNQLIFSCIEVLKRLARSGRIPKHSVL